MTGMRANFGLLISLITVTGGWLDRCPAADSPLGYTNTPVIAGQKWRVHDPDRPRPRLVTPGATFSDQAPAPADATVLFDGKDLSQWQSDKGGPARWKVAEGYMEVTPKTGQIETKAEFGDFQLHLEFATPAQVKGNSQGRGNSGIFLHGRYELQILDVYENLTYPDGQTGGIYGQYPPLVNPIKPPGTWQTYDIIFEAPRFDTEGRLLKKASVTALLNGVVVQHKQEYLGPTKHREVTSYDGVTSSRGPIALQDHGDLVRFRNIWIRPLGEHDRP
jgi:hypothetical protein